MPLRFLARLASSACASDGFYLVETVSDARASHCLGRRCVGETAIVNAFALFRALFIQIHMWIMAVANEFCALAILV